MTAAMLTIPGWMDRSSRFAALALMLGLTACGGGTKQASTTPAQVAGASGSSQSTSDSGASAAAGNSSGRAASDPNAAGASNAPVDANGQPQSSNAGSLVDAAGPPVTLPSYDPDPAVAKAQVEQHLQVARAALSGPVPDAETALREARLALQVDAASVDAAAMIAFSYYHKRLYDTAELVLDDLFKRESAKQNANVYYIYGLVYDHTNRPEQAVMSFKKAVEINPEHVSALINLGVHQLQNSQYTEALSSFERLVRQFGRSDVVTLTSLGSAYRGHAADFPAGSPDRDDNVRKAEAAYKRALQASSGYGPAYYNLGLLYLDNDPFPGLPDTLLRLNTSKSYFDQYKNMQNVDMKLYDDRMKDVTKAIKRAEKQLKKSKGSGGSAATPAPEPAAPPAKAKAKRR